MRILSANPMVRGISIQQRLAHQICRRPSCVVLPQWRDTPLYYHRPGFFLFSAATAVRMASSVANVKFSAGADEQALGETLKTLLASAAGGGRWALTPGGEGLERSFKFKTFAKTWVSWIPPGCILAVVFFSLPHYSNQPPFLRSLSRALSDSNSNDRTPYLERTAWCGSSRIGLNGGW